MRKGHKTHSSDNPHEFEVKTFCACLFFFLPSPPGSYYQMTIYSRHPLGKRFHKHQDFKSRKGHN